VNLTVVFFELNDLPNVLVYESAQPGEWGVIVNSEFKLKVDSNNPSDEFLRLYIDMTSPQILQHNLVNLK
jgi:hypothetical protein